MHLASSAEESREANTRARAVVANASSRAISSRFVAVSVKRIGARGTLLQVAGGASIACVTETADMLHSVPRQCVYSVCFSSQVLLGPAGASVVAAVGTQSSLTSYAFVAGEARTCSSFSVTNALVGAFGPWVQIVGIHDFAYPSIVVGTGALRAVGANPFGLTVKTGEAFAVVVHFASAMVRAVILAQPSLAMSLLVPGHFTPRFSFICGSA